MSRKESRSGVWGPLSKAAGILLGILLGLVFLYTLSLMSGCIGIQDRFVDKKIEYVYQPTCEDAGLIAIPFRDGSKMSSEGRTAKAYCTLFLPLTVVDLPFEVVFDTIFLPWDVWEASKNRRWKPGTEETEKIVSE